MKHDPRVGRLTMAAPVRLSGSSYEHARQLIRERHVVLDDRDAWSEHEPSAAEENAFIEEHGWREFARWHLGVDDSKREDTKARYRYPYGDFRDVHRCGVLSAESRAAQQEHEDVAAAAAHLHGMLEALR
jgi:hypothetical protein